VLFFHRKKFIAPGRPAARPPPGARTRFYAMDFFTRTASAAAEMFRTGRSDRRATANPGFHRWGMLVPRRPRQTAPHLRHNALRARDLGAGFALIRRGGEALVPARGWTTWRLASLRGRVRHAIRRRTANALVHRARDLGATIIHYHRVYAIASRAHA